MAGPFTGSRACNGLRKVEDRGGAQARGARGFLDHADHRNPAADEIAACRPYLEEQIALIVPAVVVTLGNFATQLLMDRTDGIGKLRGSVYPYGAGHLVPTYHPAYVLRAGGEAMAEMRADLVRAKRLVAERPS